MKVYISLPITGHNLDRCRNRAEKIKNMIRAKGHEAITPFDICPEINKPYSFYMGKDIEQLLECDAIFLCSGWSESKGCNLEWECAKIYKLKIFHHIGEIKKYVAQHKK